jgi:hypothetical protein
VVLDVVVGGGARGARRAAPALGRGLRGLFLLGVLRVEPAVADDLGQDLGGDVGQGDGVALLDVCGCGEREGGWKRAGERKKKREKRCERLFVFPSGFFCPFRATKLCRLLTSSFLFLLFFLFLSAPSLSLTLHHVVDRSRHLGDLHRDLELLVVRGRQGDHVLLFFVVEGFKKEKKKK